MSEQRRSSRADRRRRTEPNPDVERRKGAPAGLAASSRVCDGELVIYVQEPLTADNSAAARQVLLNLIRHAPPTPLVVDLHGCSYIETPGLSVLFELKRDMESAGISFQLQNPSRPVLRMLNITRMARLFPVRLTNTDHELIPVVRNSPPPLPTPKLEDNS